MTDSQTKPDEDDIDVALLDAEPEPEGPSVEVDTETGAAKPVEATESAPQAQEAQAAPPAAEAKDPGLEALQRNLAQSQARQKQAEERAAAAERLAQENHQRAEQARKGALSSEYVAAENALQRLSADQKAAKQALAVARAEGNLDAETDAITALTQIAQDLRYMETYKDQVVEAQKRPTVSEGPVLQEQPREQPVQPIDPVEAFASRVAANSPKSAEWVRAHPDVVTDKRLYGKMVSAHWDALAEGIKPDSPEYFDLIEQRTGYKQAPVEQAAPVRVETVQAPAPQQVRRASVAAPVSRDTPIGMNGRTSTTVTLTPAQLQMAKDLDMTPVEYAKQVLEIEKDRRAGLLN